MSHLILAETTASVSELKAIAGARVGQKVVKVAKLAKIGQGF